MANTSALYCIDVPPKVNSRGIWSNLQNPIFDYSLPVLHLQMFVIFAITELWHFVLKNFGLPKFVSQVMAGFILGPGSLGNFKKLKDVVFPEKSKEINDTMGLFSYIMFSFIIGVKIDVGILFNTGRVALYIGTLAILVPILIGTMTNWIIMKHFMLTEQEASNLEFLATLLSTTQFHNVVIILDELNITNSELGRLCISSSMVSNIFSFSIIFFAIIIRLCRQASLAIGLLSCSLMIAFFIFLKFAIRPLMFWIIKQTPEGRPIKGMYIHIIMVLMFMTGLFTNEMGHYPLVGPFLLGLAVPDGPPLGSALVEKFEGFLMGVLLPFMVSTVIMEIDIRHIKGNVLTSSSILVVVILVAKVGACLIPPLYCKMPRNDSLSIALIMTCKGIGELATYSQSRGDKDLMIDNFVVLPISALINSIIVPILVRYLYDPSRKYSNYRRRNLMDSEDSTTLRILACVYKPENICTIINLLDASNATKVNPIQIDVLHLIELVGRSSPIFISHQLQKKVISKHSYSENIINSFRQYERMNYGSVLVNIFTAISPQNLMHEDICLLALNKQSSFILLPFHKKWALDGSIEIEDYSKRALNCSILEKAPCSVGILIDYSNTRGPKSTYGVCMVFLGGNDDREALTFAKRMCKSSWVRLTVLRLISKSDNGDLDWDKMLDSEELKGVKPDNDNDNDNGQDQDQDQEQDLNATYIEKEVNDGSHTATLIQSIVNEYDLIIVGRRHGINTSQLSGLTEWSEFPELGELGDLLASKDMNMKGVILVVQQHVI